MKKVLIPLVIASQIALASAHLDNEILEFIAHEPLKFASALLTTGIVILLIAITTRRKD
jgi:hypothetical protein